MDNKDVLLITELLSGHMIHDFANSVSGIMFALEELEASFSKNLNLQKEALAFLKESSDDLICKYKIIKQAYSFSPDNTSFNHTKSNIENYLLKKKIKLTWKMDRFYTKMRLNLIKKINKIITNMVITIVNGVAEFQSISILLRQEKWNVVLTMQVLSEQKTLGKSLIEKLSKKISNNLNTKDITIYMTSLLLNQYNAEIHFSFVSNNLLEINLTLN